MNTVPADRRASRGIRPWGRLRAILAAAAVLAALAGSAPTAAAKKLLYSLNIPDNQPVTYEIPLELAHPGRMLIHAEWPGKRMVALRVDAPGGYLPVARRSGTSPLEIEIEIDPQPGELFEWKLTIHSLAARGGGEGRLSIDLPDPPPANGAEAQPARPAPPPREQDPWMVARRAPAGSPPDWQRLFQATERFRAILDSPEAERFPDSCRWQNDLLRWLAGQRDALVDRGELPAEATRRVLAQIADAVRAVDEVRTSRDPLIAGPPPADPQRRELWLTLRREEIQPVEYALDEVMESVLRNHAPALEGQEWPMRLITCLTACERHFEERVRVGEEQAINRELTRLQWDRLLAAGDALRALSELRSSRLSPS